MTPGATTATVPPTAAPRAELLTPLGRLYDPVQCRALLATLVREVDWQTDYRVFGRRFEVPRLQAWYADPGVHYRYSNNLLERKDWIAPLEVLRDDVERISGHGFNAVLVTYYRDGDDHVTWHADDEPELGEAPVIASLSLGATRRFEFQPKRGGASDGVTLHDGELLLMQPAFQHHWLHRVAPQPAVAGRRINLTFRHVHPAQQHL